jgi:predicted O-methyltransferase YrrM
MGVSGKNIFNYLIHMLRATHASSMETLPKSIVLMTFVIIFSVVSGCFWVFITDNLVVNKCKSGAKNGISTYPICDCCRNSSPLKPSFHEIKLWLQSLDLFHNERGHSDMEGYSSQNELQVQIYYRLFSTAKSVSEIGFNGGHSSLVMLASGVEKVVEFDIGEHGYTRPAFEHIKSLFPERSFEIYFGDSSNTVPEYHKNNKNVTFDIVIVDGGHQHHQAVQDIKNMAKLARKDTILMIDDTPCVESFCVTKAVEECKAEGLITVTNRIAFGQSRGVTLARYIFNDIE